MYIGDKESIDYPEFQFGIFFPLKNLISTQIVSFACFNVR